LLREIVSIRDDTQLAYALLRLCYHAKATFLARNVYPAAAAADELKRFDALVLAAVAAIMQEPDATVPRTAACDGAVANDWDDAVALISSAAWDGSVPVTLTALQQQQVRLSHSWGGLGLPETAHRSDAAFAGRTSTVLKATVASLSATQRAYLAPRLLDTTLLQQLQHVISSLLAKGVKRERLDQLLRPDLVAWALSPTADTAATYNTWLFEAGGADHEAAQEAPPVRVQAALTKHTDAHLADAFERALRNITSVSQRMEGLARWQSQCGKAACAYLSVLPTTDTSLQLDADLQREAMRRQLGIERTNPGGLWLR
jgi:hypothetical protein